jgi:hypothetical protein
MVTEQNLERKLEITCVGAVKLNMFGSIPGIRGATAGS